MQFLEDKNLTGEMSLTPFKCKIIQEIGGQASFILSLLVKNVLIKGFEVDPVVNSFEGSHILKLIQHQIKGHIFSAH